uniref:Uncharacterized protein n=1 Tax=Rhizophora mucronata TaxID=61149 RepID=A0A2P2P8I6_RHIMU
MVSYLWSAFYVGIFLKIF